MAPCIWFSTTLCSSLYLFPLNSEGKKNQTTLNSVLCRPCPIMDYIFNDVRSALFPLVRVGTGFSSISVLTSLFSLLSPLLYLSLRCCIYLPLVCCCCLTFCFCFMEIKTRLWCQQGFSHPFNLICWTPISRSVASLLVTDIKQNNYTNNYMLPQSQVTLRVCNRRPALVWGVTFKLKLDEEREWACYEEGAWEPCRQSGHTREKILLLPLCSSSDFLNPLKFLKYFLKFYFLIEV